MSSANRLMSTSSSFDKVAVIGLGLMGHGICQVAAMAGIHSSIVAFESEVRFLDKGKERIENSLKKLAAKGKISDADEVLQKILFTTDSASLGDVDFVVEAVVENLDLKKDLYRTLSHVCKPECIFASNTSSLSITQMAENSDRPDKFVGVHFFNPVQVMKLVEVIRTKHTSEEVYDKAYNWVSQIGKVPVSCGDTPGFIVNRLLVPSLIQAMCMVDRSDATVKDIDISMQLGCGHPMGPLHLADYIGLDTCYYIIDGWTKNFPNEPAFIMPECLKVKVQAGHLGRKTGKGFYHWNGETRADPVT